MMPGKEAANMSASPSELEQVLHDYMDVTRRLQHPRTAGGAAERTGRQDRELEVGRRLAALGELAAGLATKCAPVGHIQL